MSGRGFDDECFYTDKTDAQLPLALRFHMLLINESARDIPLTPLMCAVLNSSEDMVDMILDNSDGHILCHRTDSGLKALDLAVMVGNVSIAKKLHDAEIAYEKQKISESMNTDKCGQHDDDNDNDVDSDYATIGHSRGRDAERGFGFGVLFSTIVDMLNRESSTNGGDGSGINAGDLSAMGTNII